MDRVGIGWSLLCVVCVIAVAWGPPARAWGADGAAERERYSQLAVEALAEEIEAARALLDEPWIAADPDRVARLLLRLGTSSEEMAEQLWFRQVLRADAEYESCLLRGEAGCELPSGEPGGEAAAYARAALDTYARLRAKHPGYERLDEAAFREAVTRQWLGDAEGAQRGFEELVLRHPHSAFAGDSWLAIGEARFDAGYAYKALEAYEAAAAAGDDDIALYARYKAGWCSYNLGEFDAAIAAMEAVVRESDRSAAEGVEPRVAVRDEAIADLVLFLAESEDLDAALDRLGRLGRGPDSGRVLIRFARVYAEQGRTDQAVAAWRGLVANDPMAPECPTWQTSIVDAEWSSDHFEAAHGELVELLERYGPGSRWSAAHADDATALAATDALLESTLRRLAVEAFGQGKKRRSRDLCLLAEDLYGRYLGRYPAAEAAYEMRFWHAELLYDLGRYDLAAAEYTRTVEADPDGQYLEQAALNTIFAIEKHLEGMSAESRPSALPR